MRYATLPYSTLQLRLQLQLQLRYARLHYTDYTTLLPQHNTTLHHAALHYTPLRSITLHYITATTATATTTALQYPTLCDTNYIKLCSTTLHNTTLQYTATHYSIHLQLQLGLFTLGGTVHPRQANRYTDSILIILTNS